MTSHQQKQIEIINTIENQIRSNTLQATTVEPVLDFNADNRMCLTSVHFPHEGFINNVYSSISLPLMRLFPTAYFYAPSSLHLTIKNIRVINDPPTFTDEDSSLAIDVFNKVIKKHKKFSIYPYRLLLFKNNLALMSTTDEELDSIILELDAELYRAGIPDDKKYINPCCFFSNMTIARFRTLPPLDFINKVDYISSHLDLKPYIVDSVSLITSNAVMKKLYEYKKWVLE